MHRSSDRARGKIAVFSKLRVRRREKTPPQKNLSRLEAECLFMQSRCVCQNVSEGAWLAVNIINPAERVPERNCLPSRMSAKNEIGHMRADTGWQRANSCVRYTHRPHRQSRDGSADHILLSIRCHRGSDWRLV